MTTVGASSAPLVAICTPVYNGEKYLAQTMGCVQAQTYPNLVHVILDNASTDSTPEIIERYWGGSIPLLLARNLSTVSQSENLNRVLAMMPSDAQYFRLLCADDLILPEATAKAVEIMECDPDVGLVLSAEADGKWAGWPSGNVFDGLAMVAEYFRGRLPASFAHGVYRHRFLQQRAPRFYDNRLNNDDVDVGLATMCQAKVGYVHEPQVLTREHKETVTSREMGRDKIHFAEWLVFLERYGPLALDAKEYQEIKKLYKRFYFRRLLRWRFTEGKKELVRRHLSKLDLVVARPTLADYLDAVVDWPLKTLRIRPSWMSYPQW